MTLAAKIPFTLRSQILLSLLKDLAFILLRMPPEFSRPIDDQISRITCKYNAFFTLGTTLGTYHIILTFQTPFIKVILSQYPASVSDIIHLYKGIRSEHIENSRLVSGALIFALTAQAFLLGGCIESSEYGSALEYAEKWCGPCKEVDSYEADDDLVIHKMKDKEYRFTYVVSADHLITHSDI